MSLLTKEQTKKFIESALKRAGKPYCWPCSDNSYSGKDLKGAKYPETYDCSGLVTCSLADATIGDHQIDRRTVWNAQRLSENCSQVNEPAPGDLCFYGPSWALVTHVMIYVGPKHKEGVCFGSSGGDHRTVSPEVAQAMNASVRGFKTHLYRGDFLGFGRLETADE